MIIDDDTLKQLLRIDDELFQLCKFLNEKHDMETSSRLFLHLDDLTHLLIDSGWKLRGSWWTNACPSDGIEWQEAVE